MERLRMNHIVPHVSDTMKALMTSTPYRISQERFSQLQCSVFALHYQSLFLKLDLCTDVSVCTPLAVMLQSSYFPSAVARRFMLLSCIILLFILYIFRGL
jgi:hypothetical protein